MIRLKKGLANVDARRTAKPLYEKHQATPHHTYLDPDETGQIYSGMVMAKTGADEVSLADGATQDAFGLSALDKNDVMDDSGDGSNAWAVWQGGPDAEFLIFAPAFDTGVAYAVPTTGVAVPLFAGTGAARGKLTSANTGRRPVAQLLEVVSSTAIRIRLQAPSL